MMKMIMHGGGANDDDYDDEYHNFYAKIHM